MAYVVLSASRFSAWEWVPLAAGLIIIMAIAMAGIAGPGGHGRGSGLGGRGRDDDGPAGAAAHRWRMLVMVSRLMPRPAGWWWLAEAESVLSEIAAARRGAAIGSYLLSAPRLVVMMWAREVLLRARPGPRHSGDGRCAVVTPSATRVARRDNLLRGEGRTCQPWEAPQVWAEMSGRDEGRGSASGGKCSPSHDLHTFVTAVA